MKTRLYDWWMRRRGQSSITAPSQQSLNQPTALVNDAPGVDIAPDDVLIAHFQHDPGAVEVDKLDLPSVALHQMRAAGVKLLVPLVSQGELIGLLQLGPRLSRQEYSADDRRLLNNLAAQAAPAVRVAQLVRQQQVEVQARERIEQELRVARLIQQTLLPKDEPIIPGWQIKKYYQPARAVGGDFYDFLQFADGRLGLIIGDVTDKGVPAALVMATTRSVLRTAAVPEASPGQVLGRVNELLNPDMPPNMFVTCLYAILNPATGHIRYANAGHMPPYRRTATDVSELRATGLPLGLLRGIQYEEREAQLLPGETLLFYSDGLVEAHSPQRELFGFPRLAKLMQRHPGGAELIPFLLNELIPFTGAAWEQEDDITLMTLQRVARSRADLHKHSGERVQEYGDLEGEIVADFNIASLAGNERLAVEYVAAALDGASLPWKLSQARLERLKTALAEATMNAIEHGNQYRVDVPVTVCVLVSPHALVARITDRGGRAVNFDAEVPDIAAKLAGLQTPRGWGLFLIKNLVDEVRVSSDDAQQTVELIMYCEGAPYAP